MSNWKHNPGSEQALTEGCTCAVLDNARGKGWFGDGEKYGWWITTSCPLHGERTAAHSAPEMGANNDPQ